LTIYDNVAVNYADVCMAVTSQLYGEADPDQDVSPDTEDPEAAG